MSGNESPTSTTNMAAVYYRLANRLFLKVDELQRQRQQQRQQHPQCKSQQYWIAIAGGPGSGKSTSAEAVAERLNAYQKDCCVIVPADGFYYSQQQLTALYGPEAMLRRGAPFTFDAEGLVKVLTKVKEDCQGKAPGYDRRISDPVPDQILIRPHHCIVIVEGLYLLHVKDPRWAPLGQLWDERWFVKAPSREIQRQRLVQRSVLTWSELKTQQWGPGEEGATKRADGNDVLNMILIEYCEDNANEVIVTC